MRAFLCFIKQILPLAGICFSEVATFLSYSHVFDFLKHFVLNLNFLIFMKKLLEKQISNKIFDVYLLFKNRLLIFILCTIGLFACQKNEIQEIPKENSQYAN
ncbi:MAG: hypothetical protein MUE81_20865 [Thermoflexibacter sp.]|nr:hypothetical protein [Thermoflexibacter sp.]